MARKTATQDESKVDETTVDATETEQVEDAEVLEDLDESQPVDEKPAAPKGDKPAKAKAAPTVAFGTAQLAKLLSEATGKTIDGRALRVFLRKEAQKPKGEGVIHREIGSGRYSWTGADDAEVVKIVEAVKSGALEAARKEDLDKLKARGEAKKAEKAASKGETAESTDEQPAAEAEELSDDEVEDLQEA